MKYNCTLCGEETEKMIRIAHSPRPICFFCEKNIIEPKLKSFAEIWNKEQTTMETFIIDKDIQSFLNKK